MTNKEKLEVELEVPSNTLHVQHAYCPHGHSLIDSEVRIHGYPSIKVRVGFKHQKGYLYLDPVYGSHDNIEKGVDIPQGGVVKFYCSHCGTDLTTGDDTCQLCASPMFIFHLPNKGIVEGCLKKGCYYHKLRIVDAEQQIARLFRNDTLESYL